MWWVPNKYIQQILWEILHYKDTLYIIKMIPENTDKEWKGEGETRRGGVRMVKWHQYNGSQWEKTSEGKTKSQGNICMQVLVLQSHSSQIAPQCLKKHRNYTSTSQEEPKCFFPASYFLAFSRFDRKETVGKKFCCYFRLFPWNLLSSWHFRV